MSVQRRESPAHDYPGHECPGHECPALDRALARRLAGCVRSEPWLLRALDAVAASGLPDAWIGAGVIRDVVWGQACDGFDPAAVRDIDVAFFDPGNLSRQRDQDAQQILEGLAELPWEATNQAAVHTWYHRYFGGPPVPAFSCVHDAVATWPETATCVAIRKAPGGIEICAPHGLTDLMSKTWRQNPVRVSIDVSRARLARHRERWPDIAVVPLAMAERPGRRPPLRPPGHATGQGDHGPSAAASRLGPARS